MEESIHGMIMSMGGKAASNIYLCWLIIAINGFEVGLDRLMKPKNSSPHGASIWLPITTTLQPHPHLHAS